MEYSCESVIVPPRVRTIAYCGTLVKLAFPKFIFYLEHNWECCNSIPSSTLQIVFAHKEKFLPFFLWNVNEFGVVCLPDFPYFPYELGSAPIGIGGYIDLFWQSSFNEDIAANVFLPLKCGYVIRFASEWHGKTRSNPDFMKGELDLDEYFKAYESKPFLHDRLGECLAAGGKLVSRNWPWATTRKL